MRGGQKVVPLGAVNTGLLTPTGTGCSAERLPGMPPRCTCAAITMASRAPCIASAAGTLTACDCSWGCSGCPSGHTLVSADSCSSAPPSLYFWSMLLARTYCQPRGLLQRLQRRSTSVYSPVDSLRAGGGGGEHGCRCLLVQGVLESGVTCSSWLVRMQSWGRSLIGGSAKRCKRQLWWLLMVCVAADGVCADVCISQCVVLQLLAR